MSNKKNPEKLIWVCDAQTRCKQNLKLKPFPAEGVAFINNYKSDNMGHHWLIIWQDLKILSQVLFFMLNSGGINILDFQLQLHGRTTYERIRSIASKCISAEYLINWHMNEYFVCVFTLTHFLEENKSKNGFRQREDEVPPEVILLLFLHCINRRVCPLLFGWMNSFQADKRLDFTDWLVSTPPRPHFPSTLNTRAQLLKQLLFNMSNPGVKQRHKICKRCICFMLVSLMWSQISAVPGLIAKNISASSLNNFSNSQAETWIKKKIKHKEGGSTEEKS